MNQRKKFQDFYPPLNDPDRYIHAVARKPVLTSPNLN